MANVPARVSIETKGEGDAARKALSVDADSRDFNAPSSADPIHEPDQGPSKAGFNRAVREGPHSTIRFGTFPRLDVVRAFKRHAPARGNDLYAFQLAEWQLQNQKITSAQFRKAMEEEPQRRKKRVGTLQDHKLKLQSTLSEMMARWPRGTSMYWPASTHPTHESLIKEIDTVKEWQGAHHSFMRHLRKAIKEANNGDTASGSQD